MEEQEIVDNLINVGVTVLKEYGHSEVTKDNILTDNIHKEFYKQILTENLGVNQKVDEAIKIIFQKME
jgi:hypothetical protein